MRPPRAGAASAADTGFARARRGFSTAQRAQLVERSYTREARLLKASRFRLKVRIAEFAGCGTGEERGNQGEDSVQGKAAGEVGGCCGGKATVSAVAKTGRGIADEDRAPALFVDTGDRCRPAIAPPLEVGGRHARRAAPVRRL